MRTRRQFLAVSAIAAVTASLPRRLWAERLGGDVFANGNLGAAAQGLLNIDTFQHLLGETFTMFVENNSVAYLRLLRVNDAKTATIEDLEKPLITISGAYVSPVPTTPRKQKVQQGLALNQFTLSFTSTGAPFTQDSYIVDHGRLGRFAMFVVPTCPQVCHATFATLPNAVLPKVILPRLGAPISL